MTPKTYHSSSSFSSLSLSLENFIRIKSYMRIKSCTRGTSHTQSLPIISQITLTVRKVMTVLGVGTLLVALFLGNPGIVFGTEQSFSTEGTLDAQLNEIVVGIVGKVFRRRHAVGIEASLGFQGGFSGTTNAHTLVIRITDAHTERKVFAVFSVVAQLLTLLQGQWIVIGSTEQSLGTLVGALEIANIGRIGLIEGILIR